MKKKQTTKVEWKPLETNYAHLKRVHMFNNYFLQFAIFLFLTSSNPYWDYFLLTILSTCADLLVCTIIAYLPLFQNVYRFFLLFTHEHQYTIRGVIKFLSMFLLHNEVKIKLHCCKWDKKCSLKTSACELYMGDSQQIVKVNI